MNSKDVTAAIARFPKEYREMMGGKLSRRQLQLLDGADIKSHEGMIFGQNHFLPNE